MVRCKFDRIRALHSFFLKPQRARQRDFGNYAPGQPIELNASQVFPAAFGGKRNHFARDVGRKLKLTLNADGTGDLSGTFEERIYGMFGQPVSLTGTVRWAMYRTRRSPSFTLSKEVGMPPAPRLPTADAPRTAAMLGWGEPCPQVDDRGIVYRGCNKSYDATHVENRLDCFETLQARFSRAVVCGDGGSVVGLRPTRAELRERHAGVRIP